MKFRLQTVLWVFALLASAMATFSEWGILATLFVASFWAVAFGKLRINLVEWLVTVGIIFVLVALFLPTGYSRRPSVRSSCLNNLNQFVSAIQYYEKTHGTLPPAYTTDEKGKPLHSWRVLLLPYIEHQYLYNAIHLDEPWDSPHNRKLWDKMPDIYRCPGCEVGCDLGLLPSAEHSTSYFAVVGPQTVWTGGEGSKLEEISDDQAKTLLLIEAYKPDSCWMEPSDLTTEQAIELMCTNKSPGHLHVEEGLLTDSVSTHRSNLGFVDGRVLWSNELVDKKLARSFLTRNGNEKNVEDQRPSRFRSTNNHRLAVAYHWKRIYSFTLFILLSLLPLAKFRRRHVLAKLVG